MSPRYTDCIFDLDGTLTRPGLIDFAGLKAQIGCPQQRTVIEFLRTLGGAELRRAWTAIDRFERAALPRALPNPEAHRVLATLREWNVSCYVLTRNSRPIARATLRCLRLQPFIRDVIAREDARLKPDPAGIHRLRGRWGFARHRALMVGDFHFDVWAGAAAGIATAFLTNRKESPAGRTFPTGHPTHAIADLVALLRLF